MQYETPIKAMRIQSGLSQREVERRAGLSTGRLSVIERGLVPTEDERRKLMAILTEALNAPKEIA
jgi:transcriptional regulator with XRE-family HTH domain